MPSGTRGRVDLYSLGLLTLACLLGATRLLYLGRWSLWLDEAYTLADARRATTSLNPVGYRLCVQRDLRVHPGLDPTVAIREEHGDPARACIRIDDRIDRLDRTFEDLVRECRERDLGSTAFGQGK